MKKDVLLYQENIASNRSKFICQLKLHRCMMYVVFLVSV